MCTLILYTTYTYIHTHTNTHARTHTHIHTQDTARDFFTNQTVQNIILTDPRLLNSSRPFLVLQGNEERAFFRRYGWPKFKPLMRAR